MNYREAVGSFQTQLLAECAIQDLQRDGLDPHAATIVGCEPSSKEHVVGYYNAGDRVLSWGKRGAFWGGLWGLLFSIWFFWIPGLGPVLVTIPVVIGAAALGTVAALAAALYSLGIPRDSCFRYARGAEEGRYIVMVEGTPLQISRSRAVVDHGKSLASMLNMPVQASSRTTLMNPAVAR